MVKPSTVMRWQRELIAKKFDGSAKRTYPDRPRINSALEAPIVDTTENNRWGAMRIKGSLKHIGHDVSHQTVLNVLKRHGLHPSPSREHDDSWARFLKVHLSAIVATDFLTCRGRHTSGLGHLLHSFLYSVGYSQSHCCRDHSASERSMDAAGGKKPNRRGRRVS